MHETLKNLYYVSLFALLLQFVGLFEPFAVLFGLTLLYLAFADLFMQDEIDRLRRMNSFTYKRKIDIQVAFVAMTVGFGVYYLASGVHYTRQLGALTEWLLGVGSLGALYIFLHQYLPDPRDRSRRRIRPIR